MKRAMIAVSIFLSLLTVAIGIGAGAGSTEGGADFARSSAAAPGAATSVFYEGFEGTFPGSDWITLDHHIGAGGAGEDTWGDVGVNYGFRAYAGNWSAWCASEGTNSQYGEQYNEDVHKYDVNMYSTLMCNHMYDMSPAAAADLAYVDFFAWCQTETGND